MPPAKRHARHSPAAQQPNQPKGEVSLMLTPQMPASQSASIRQASLPNHLLCPSPHGNRSSSEMNVRSNAGVKDPWNTLDQHAVNEPLEIALRQEDHQGPPGPAGHQLSLEWPTAALCKEEARKFCLWKYGTWIQALKALDLPLDDWHEGKGPATDLSISSWLREQNLAAVKEATFENGVCRKWHLLVLVRSMRAQAGEVELTVCDPTAQMDAFLDHRVLSKWPGAIHEGATLALRNAIVLHPKPSTWQLLITISSLVHHFASEASTKRLNSGRRAHVV